MTNFAEINPESPNASVQGSAYHPMLLRAGYPGMPGSAEQPAEDGSHAIGAQPNKMLAETLAAGLSKLPQPDQQKFLSLLPQEDQQQLVNFSPKIGLAGALTSLPEQDIAKALSQLTPDDLAIVFSDSSQGSLGAQGTPAMGADAGGGAAAGYPAMGADATGGAAAAYPATGADATGGAAAAYPATGADATGGATAAIPATGADATGGAAAASPAMGADATGGAVAANPAIPADATGGGAPVTRQELTAALSQLPQNDLVAFYQALPANDQNAVQTQLARSQSWRQAPSAGELINALDQLPEKDLNDTIGKVPDISAYLANGSNKITQPHRLSTGETAGLALGAAGVGAFLLHKTGHLPFFKKPVDLSATAKPGGGAIAGEVAEPTAKIAEPLAGEIAGRGRVFAVSPDGEAALRPAPLAITAAPKVGDIATAIHTSMPDAGEVARELAAAKAATPEIGEATKIVTTIANVARDIPK